MTHAERAPELTPDDQDVLHQFEESLMLLKQALRRLRAPAHPELGEHAFAILGVVRRLQPIRTSSLAAELRLAVSTVSRKVEPLVQRGWLEVRRDEHDQRAHDLSLTGAGLTALQTERRRQVHRYMELLDAETRTEFPRAVAFLNRVARTLHEAAESTETEQAGKDSKPVTAK